MWNLQFIIFIGRRIHWQIFKSALVYCNISIKTWTRHVCITSALHGTCLKLVSLALLLITWTTPFNNKLSNLFANNNIFAVFNPLKNLMFSDVFRGFRKAKPGCNGLNLPKSSAYLWFSEFDHGKLSLRTRRSQFRIWMSIIVSLLMV